MIKHKDFLGREEILEALNKRIAGLAEGYRQNIALIGSRLIGKTSIVLNLFQNLERSKFILLYVDLKPTQLNHFIYQFVVSLLYNFSAQGDEETEDITLKALIDRARPYIPKTVELLSTIKEELDRKRYRMAHLKILDAVEILNKETGKPVIFALDEFHYLDNAKIKNIFSELGKKIMVQKGVMYLLVSSSEMKAKLILNEKLNLLFGNFEIINVGPLDYQASFDFINKKLKGIILNSEIENFIFFLSGGNPFYLDIICSEIQNVYLKANQIPYDSSEIILTACKNLLFDQHGVLSQHFSNQLIRISHRHSGTKLISILLLIANNHARFKEICNLMRGTSKDAKQKIDKLIELDIILKVGTCYQFQDKFFAFWLKFVYQKRITDFGWDVTNKEREFRDDLIKYVQELSTWNKRPLKDRFVELFNTFDNETVQVDEKRLKLPKFNKVEVINIAMDNLTLIAKNEITSWLVRINKDFIDENSMSEFLNSQRGLCGKFNKKVIIELNGMDVNARLLAKENKTTIWNVKGINQIFEIFYPNSLIINEDISII